MITQQNYNTRSNDINYPVRRMTLLEKSPYYMEIRSFNKLSNEFKNIQVEKGFKTKLNSLSLDLEPYSVGDFLQRQRVVVFDIL